MSDSVYQYPQELYNTWEFVDEAQGTLTLTFKRDGTYEVDYNTDGKKDIWGKFEYWEGRILMRDDMPRITTDCYEPGIYDYSIVNDKVVFDEFADQCQPRRSVLRQMMQVKQ